jgi:moderate conductance mechanosensitive channel
MPPMPIALLQNEEGAETTRETTDSVVEEAEKGARETAGKTADILKDVAEPFNSFFGYLISAEFIANVIATVIVTTLGIFVYELLSRGVPRVLRWRRRGQVMNAETIARIKRQDTTITLVRNVLRYGVFAIVVLIVLSIFLRDALATLGGAAILAAIIGFGAQSFLRDVIAGFSTVFEGQYSVGDFIHVQPQNVSGIVEDLGLRVTKIRALSGEVSYIPNGMMQGVTNYVSGQQRFNVEVQLSDAEAASRVLSSLSEGSELYLAPPRLVGREDTEDGRVRLRIRADVLPSMAWLVEENLTERIKGAAGEEGLAAAPLVYKVDQASLQRVRELLPQEAEKNLPQDTERKTGSP